jgi:hypothetical protein
MRTRRVAILIVIFSLVGAGSIFANSAYEKYNAKKLAITLNGTAIENPGLIVDFGKSSRTMAPIQELAQTFGAIVNYDESAGTVQLIKPNVQLSIHTVTKGEKNNIELSKPFGLVAIQKYKNLAVLAQIDNLTVPVNALRVTIKDPFDTEIERVDNKIDKQDKNYWSMFIPAEINFKYIGDYTVNFFIQQSADSEFVQVSQLTIQSVK